MAGIHKLLSVDTTGIKVRFIPITRIRAKIAGNPLKQKVKAAQIWGKTAHAAQQTNDSIDS